MTFFVLKQKALSILKNNIGLGFQLRNHFPSKVSRTFDAVIQKNRPVSSEVKTSLSVREVWGSRPGSVKSNTMSPVARHRFDISSDFEAV